MNAFAKKPARAASAWRKLDSRLDLNYIFSLRYERKVGKDHVIMAVPGLAIQLPALSGGRGFAGKKVEACQQPNGDLHVYLDRRLLHVQTATPDAGPVRAHAMRKSKAPRKKKPVKIYQYAGHPAVRA